jgi:hypothetical protein
LGTQRFQRALGLVSIDVEGNPSGINAHKAESMLEALRTQGRSYYFKASLGTT